jgi:hypothetical protein
LLHCEIKRPCTVIPHNQILADDVNLSSRDATHPCQKCGASDDRQRKQHARGKQRQPARLIRFDREEYRADRRDARGVRDLRRRVVDAGGSAGADGFTVASTALDNGAMTNPRAVAEDRQHQGKDIADGVSIHSIAITGAARPAICTAQPSTSTRVPRCLARALLWREAIKPIGAYLY